MSPRLIRVLGRAVVARSLVGWHGLPALRLLVL